MRYQGRITSWKDEQGFGFITPNNCGKQVFVHITAFSNRQRRPVGNDIVTYEVNKDRNGKLKAERVQFIDEREQSTDGTLLLLFAVIFLICMAIAVFAGELPLWVLGVYLLASSCTLIAYKLDKMAAKRSHRRTPEKTLHLWALIGGWPGAIIGQKLFRHKSKKLSFQVPFWATIMINCAALAWLISMDGLAFIEDVIGRL
ncbi:cold shock and DUF1294 domain-containing protein [Methylophilus sp. TWE2]|uniref:DUF1294 domain-containing protein n=1 Tax=Methylophilus sp. TWE2 TaxID=1662285 RepID=UPI000670F06E|nr:cold shock and DUF1294 domain-containing protein [Methylophilus sp. TWE2]AKR43292.1 DNA-binding protein [Methylophilus sp. TWE2]